MRRLKVWLDVLLVRQAVPQQFVGADWSLVSQRVANWSGVAAAKRPFSPKIGRMRRYGAARTVSIHGERVRLYNTGPVYQRIK